MFQRKKKSISAGHFWDTRYILYASMLTVMYCSIPSLSIDINSLSQFSGQGQDAKKVSVAVFDQIIDEIIFVIFITLVTFLSTVHGSRERCFSE
jgi:hypothetical protein